MDMKKAINIKYPLKGHVKPWEDVIRQTEELLREMGGAAVPPDNIDGMVEAARKEEEEAIASEEKMIRKLKRLVEESVSDERSRGDALKNLEERGKELEERKNRLENQWQEVENEWRRAAEVISRSVERVRSPKDMPLVVHLIAPPKGESWATLLTSVAENPEEFSLQVWVASPYESGRAIYQAVKTLTFKRSEVPVVEMGEDGSEVVTTEYRYDAEWTPRPEGEEEGEKVAITEVPKPPPIGRRMKDTIEDAARKVVEDLLDRLEETDPDRASDLRTDLKAAESLAEIRQILDEVRSALEGRRGSSTEYIDAEGGIYDALTGEMLTWEKETREENIRDQIGKWIGALREAGYKEVARDFGKRVRRARSEEDLEAILDEIRAKAHELGVKSPEDADVDIDEGSEDKGKESLAGGTLRLVLMEKCRQVVSKYRTRKWGS